MAINDDTEFQTVVRGLTLERQRQLAARFVENVLGLCPDPRVKAAVTVAMQEGVGDAELTMARQNAKSASVESYTRCGREADWKSQAGHFVALAALASVAPAERAAALAWDAAMNARMARTCETIAEGEGTRNREAETQYRMLEKFLES